jgi:peptidoglycan hydrolase CwlO-like protein
MRKIISLLVILLSFNSIFSQIEYPRYDIDSLGQKVVVITIEQARVLNNKADLLSLFDQLSIQINEYDSVCLKVISEKEIIIAKQDIQISNFKDLVDNKDQQIENLKTQVNNYQLKEIMFSKEIENKDKEISIYKDKISDQRNRMILGGTIGGAIIVGLITLLIIN